MNFEQQTIEHLQFLREEGLEITNLQINSQEFIRCRADGELGRGEYAYKTHGLPCNPTEWERFSADAGFQMTYQPTVEKNIHLAANLEKIQQFWELSSRHGRADYLERKGVGSYRIRFRDNQHGKVAVVPITNAHDKLYGYQILNSNGSKVFAKGMQLRGAFHRLTRLTDGLAIGVAESYATAATCIELVKMPMVTTFTSNNLEHVALALQKRYPKSPLVIFADNDKVINAFKALGHSKSGGIVLTPEFQTYPPEGDHSDWNDLVREKGRVGALEQLAMCLRETQDHKIRQLYISVSELLNF